MGFTPTGPNGDQKWGSDLRPSSVTHQKEVHDCAPKHLPNNPCRSMEKSRRPKFTLVVHTPRDAEEGSIKETLTSQFPKHDFISFAPLKPDKKRATFINFYSQEAYDQAALRVGETISICGSTAKIMLSKSSQQKPKSALHAERPEPNPVANQPQAPVCLEKAHLWYFWDIENVQIPRRIAVHAAYTHDLVAAIRKHCEDLYPNHMHMDFSVMHAQQILSNAAREGLQLCNVIVQQYAGKPIKKEQADKFIITAMNTKEHLTREYYENRVFVIITNDGGYQNDLNLLREKGITIILIHGRQASRVFRRSVDYCIPIDKIFASVKTPNANVKPQHLAAVPQLKPDQEVSDDKVEGLLNKSQAQNLQVQSEHQTFSVPSRSRSNGGQKGSKRSEKSRDRGKSRERGKSRGREKPRERGESREQRKSRGREKLRDPPQLVPSRSYSRRREKSREPPQPVPSLSYSRGDKSGSSRRGKSREPPQPVPSRSYPRGNKSGSSKQGKSRESPQPVPSRSDSSRRGKSREPQATAQQHCLRVSLPQSLGSVTKELLGGCFGSDARISIKSFQSRDRHAIIIFDSAAKASQFAGRIPVNGQFVDAILLDQNSPASTNPPSVPSDLLKEVVITIQLTYPKYRYTVNNRSQITLFCQNVKTTFDDERCIIKLEGLPGPMRKANDALTKFQDSIGQETISDLMFNWFAANLFLQYHLDRIVVQWSVALFLYRNGNEEPVKALTNFKSTTDANATYYIVVVGNINQPGTKEARKYIRALQLQKSELLNITPQNQVALFRQEPGKNGNSMISISKENHCCIEVFDNKARIYAFKEKEIEGARKALEAFLVTTDKVQIHPAKSEYIRRYKTAELEAIRRKHHVVRITGTFSDNVQTDKVEPSSASSSSVTLPNQGTIFLEGPPAYVTRAKGDVMALVGQISVQTLDVSYPLRHQSMALRRFNSLAREIQSHQDIALDISPKKFAKDNEVTIHIVACGEPSVVKETLDKLSVITFLAKDTYNIPGEQIIPSGRQLDKLKTTTLEDFNVLLYFRLNDRAFDMDAEDVEHIASARANIDAFLKGENASEIFVIPNPRHRSWFEKFKNEKELSELATEHRVWIKPEKKDGHVYYKISGPQTNVEGALATFKAYTTKLTSPLQTVVPKIERQKAETILSERRRVRQIESKYKVDVLFPKREFHVTIRSTNQVIEVVLGDIALEKVDAIVNAANSRLDHLSGMAKTIADAAGQQFINECRNYIAQYGTIPTGQAVGMPAGDLQKNGVKFVIHAVGPVWKSGTSNEKEYLFAAISNALTIANTNGCKIVALPPISTGIYGFPHDKAAKTIVDAVVKTLPKTKLHKVRIIDFQPNSMFGPQEEEGEDGDVEDVDPVNSTSLYAMIRNELKDRRKELESDDDKKSDLSVLSLPKLQALPYQWFWKEDTGGKHYKGQPWIMYDHDQNVEIEDAWKKWQQYDSQSSSSVNVSPLNTQNVHSMNTNPMDTNSLNTQKSQAGIFDWFWPPQSPQLSPTLLQTPPIPPPIPPQAPPPQPLRIVGDVGGVKAGVMYEILFSTDGEHRQRNCNTGHKRPIVRKDIDITAAAKASPQVTNLPDANKRSPVDYKYWKEQLEFTITGNLSDIPTVIKEIKALAADCSEAIHMASKWGLIGKAEREAAVREIAGRLYVDAEIQPDGQVIKLTGQESSIRTVRAEIYKWAFEKSSNLEQDIPPNWTSFDESQNCILIPLMADGQEWASVASRIIQTMPNAKVKNIERVQNRHLWATFQYNHRHISKKNSGKVNTLHLFHGTRSAIPSSIYQGEEGFDPRFSALGMWGKGCYFAVNASYSSKYAHVDREVSRYKQFFLAEVITGDSVTLPPDSNLVMPPLKPKQNGQFVNERYDSVKGTTGGSDVYIVYSMGRFYPTYLVTYKD